MRLQNCKVVGGNINPESYHGTNVKRGQSDFPMSRSQLTNFMVCPLRWINGYKSPETDAMDWGTIMDCLILTPDQFSERFAVTPATYLSEKGEEKDWNWNANVCKAWRDAQGGKTIVKHSELALANAAVERLHDDARASAYVKASETQVMVVGEFKARNGLVIPLKTLIDVVPAVDSEHGKSLGDLKTATSASPGKWSRVCYQHGYHVQAALSLDLYVGATGEDRVDFRHIIQESFPPWSTGRRILSIEMVELGRQTYVMGLDFYADCLESGKWPGYDEISVRSLQGWSLTEPEPWMLDGRDLPMVGTATMDTGSTASEMPS